MRSPAGLLRGASGAPEAISGYFASTIFFCSMNVPACSR